MRDIIVRQSGKPFSFPVPNVYDETATSLFIPRNRFGTFEPFS